MFLIIHVTQTCIGSFDYVWQNSKSLVQSLFCRSGQNSTNLTKEAILPEQKNNHCLFICTVATVLFICLVRSLTRKRLFWYLVRVERTVGDDNSRSEYVIDKKWTTLVSALLKQFVLDSLAMQDTHNIRTLSAYI